MGTYRKEWSCCGSVTETDAWEPETCPFCTSHALPKKELIDFLKQELRIDVKTESNYIGDMHGGNSLYKDSHVIELVLDGEVISSIGL